MRLFWTKHRSPGDNPRAHGRSTSVDDNGPSRAFNDDNVTGLAGAVFDDEDWDQIDNLLSGDNELGSSCQWEQSRAAVTSSLAELKASVGAQVVPSGPVLDRLLDLWTLVHQVDPLAARPLEPLLSSLVARDLVSAQEVTDTWDEVEAALEAQRGRASDDAPGPVARRVPGKTTGTNVSSEEGAR
jgi:hypothetical protein